MKTTYVIDPMPDGSVVLDIKWTEKSGEKGRTTIEFQRSAWETFASDVLRAVPFYRQPEGRGIPILKHV